MAVTTAQALREAFDAFIRRSERYEQALQEIATGTSGDGDVVDIEVIRTIALRALGRLPND